MRRPYMGRVLGSIYNDKHPVNMIGHYNEQIQINI